MKAKKLLSIFLSIAILISIFAVPVSAETVPTDAWLTYAADDFADGTGTEDDPYLIATEEQLAKLSVDVANGNGYTGEWFKLTDDLDLSAHRWNPIGQYRNATGDFTYSAFYGNFDGNEKTIRGIYVNETTDGISGGLFGCINSGNNELTIRDLTIEDAVIYGTEAGLAQGFGGILGAYITADIEKSILIENVHVSGSLNITCEYGNYSVGGMVGYADNITFIDCTVDDIYQYAATNSGGFTGMSSNCTYTDCSARGTVYGSWAMGGFAGYTTLQDSRDGDTHSTFTRCIADVDVIANDWNVGGFVGLSVGGVFTDCAALGDVESQVTNWEPHVAGFAGKLQAKYDDTEPGPYPSILTNCYFAGKISSAHETIQPSGLVAVVEGNSEITDCAYDGDKNPDIEGYADEEAPTASSTLGTGSAICENVIGGHVPEDNTCTVCGYTEYSVTLGGVKVANVNAADILGDGTASYDAETNTLTLNGCTVESFEANIAALQSSDSLIVVLEGVNTLSGYNGGDDSGISSAVHVTGGLVLQGTGTLNAHGGKNATLGSIGINVYDGDLTIKGGCTVNATSYATEFYSRGISNQHGAVIIESATVNAVAGYAAEGASYGIEANSLALNTATVTASADPTSQNGSLAVYTSPDPTLSYENGYLWKTESNEELSATVIDWETVGSDFHIEPEIVATVQFKAVDATVNAESPSEKPALAGTRFNILDEDGNAVHTGLVTTETPLAEATLEAGAAYELVVTKPSDGFAIPQAIEFTVDADGNVEAAGGYCYDNVIAIELEPCLIQLYVPAGSKFNITYEDDNSETQTLLTHEVVFTGAAQLDGFKHETDYTITFETAPDGYSLPDDVTFRFDDEGVLRVTDYGRHAVGGTFEGREYVRYILEELGTQSRPSTGVKTHYKVQFETNGGSAVASRSVTRNSTISEPTAPSKDGYSFMGWFTDKELTLSYDFGSKVTKDFTLYAKWEKHDDETPATPDRENPFTDVKTSDWYYEDVIFAVKNGLFTGITSTTFAPNNLITRAMFVTVLYRLEGEPEITGTATFEDVDPDAYYAKAVVWGQQNGIVKGYSETEFAPDQNIIREQIAAIIFRYAQYKEIAPTGAWAIRLDYNDLAHISEYAVESVMYCKLKGIMQGKNGNSFAPKDNATRAEIAAILHRFIEVNK